MTQHVPVCVYVFFVCVSVRTRVCSCLCVLRPSDSAAACPMAMVYRAIRAFEESRYALLRQRNVIGQVCDTPKSYDNVMHVGLRKVTFKWQRGNKIGM